jgi:hypothetical protein
MNKLNGKHVKLYYVQVLLQLLVIMKHKASVIIAPVEFAIPCLSPPGPPFPGVGVQMKSAHNDPNEVKNIIGNLLHMGLFEAMVKGNSAIDELNQTVKDELE